MIKKDGVLSFQGQLCQVFQIAGAETVLVCSTWYISASCQGLPGIHILEYTMTSYGL
jgi:hypothetical protein